MKYNEDFFIKGVNRKNTGSSKWDAQYDKFNADRGNDMIAMWIADMDFCSPEEVRQAIIRRASDGMYGYTYYEDSTLDSIVSWVRNRWNWEIEKDWIVFTPGVIPGFNVAFQNYSEPGDSIVIQQPVYYPFMDSIRNNGRNILINELVEKNCHWSIDFDQLEKQLRGSSTKILIISNPHNPVGRCWTREELNRIGDLCIANNVLLISDEVHADLIMSGHKHQPAAAISDSIMNNTITHFAPSKTFNLAGLQTAYAVIPNKAIRERFIAGMNANRIGSPNYFGQIALRTAYNECSSYVDALCSYVESNMDYMKTFIDDKLPMLKMRKSEATYLVWVDFRGTGMSSSEIESFIIKEAHISVDMGSWFGKSGEGWLRFNLACPRSILEKAMNNLLTAFREQ